MTAIILYHENIRKFIEALTSGDVQYRSVLEEPAGNAGAIDPEGNAAARHPFLRFHCDWRKGVNLPPAVPMKTTGQSGK